MMNVHNNTTEHHNSLVQLEVLNSEEALVRLPVRVFIGILAVLGILGNTHVLYIYSTKFKRSTYRTFVLTLSTIDMIGCCVSMPFEIADETLPYLFQSSIACKIFRYINTCIAISCAMTLVLVASERYRKICKPQERQLTEVGALYSVMGVFLATCVFASPAIYVYGLKTIRFEEYTFTGTECTWGDHMEDSIFGYLYYAMLLIIVIGCMISLAVLYILVGIKLSQHEKATRKTLKSKQKAARDSNVKSGFLTPQVNRKNTTKPTFMRHFSSCENINDQIIQRQRARLSSSCEVLCDVKSKRSESVDGENKTNENVEQLHGASQRKEPVAQCHNFSNTQSSSRESARNSHLSLSTDNKQVNDENSGHLNDIVRNGKIPGDNAVDRASGMSSKSKENETFRISDIDRALQQLSSVQEETDLLNENNDKSDTCKDLEQAPVPTDRNSTETKIASPTSCFKSFPFRKRGVSETSYNMRNTFTRILQLGNRDSDSRRNSQESNVFKFLNFKRIFSIDDKEKRITKVLFTITMLFILSFIPYIVILIVYAIDEDFEDGMTIAERRFYLIGLRLYNINNVANSLLYCLFDLKFRKHCVEMYRTLASFCSKANKVTIRKSSP